MYFVSRSCRGEEPRRGATIRDVSIYTSSSMFFLVTFMELKKYNIPPKTEEPAVKAEEPEEPIQTANPGFPGKMTMPPAWQVAKAVGQDKQAVKVLCQPENQAYIRTQGTEEQKKALAVILAACQCPTQPKPTITPAEHVGALLELEELPPSVKRVLKPYALDLMEEADHKAALEASKAAKKR